MADGFGNNGNNNPLGNQPLPVGGIRVGNRVMFPNLVGDLFNTPGQAINSNQRIEPDLSRGASGACNQDAGKVPTPK